MQRIVPHLWFDKEAREAAEFYANTFDKDSKILSITTLKNTPSGDADVVSFTVRGYEIQAISAGPYFTLTPAISISVQCIDEADIDNLFAKLSLQGEVLMPLDWYPWEAKYAWINDRYGVSWQLNLFKDQSQVKDRVSPALLFVGDVCGKAEEAMNLYTSTFPDGKILFTARYGANSTPDKEGTIMHGEFSLFGETLMALDSAREHKFSFTEAVSLIVRSDSQEEMDRYSNALSAVPSAEQCGWLKDKFGVSWQIVPKEMDEMLRNGTEEQIARLTKAFLPMKRFNLKELKRAYEG